MNLARRHVLIGMGAVLASCEQPSARRAGPLSMDKGRLDREFTAIAARARPALLNAGIAIVSTGETWSADDRTRMPLQSVFNAALAGAALAEVDAGHLRLDERITVTAEDLSPLSTAMNSAWPTPPDGHVVTMPAIDLIALAVQQSDNTAADVIMKRIGGPVAVTGWLHSKQIDDFTVDRYERELQQELAGMPPFRPEWKDKATWLAARDSEPSESREAAANAYLADPRDTTTVPAALKFLRLLALGQLLAPTSTNLLLRLMTHTDTGLRRLRAGLPASATLAHKTGAAPTDLGRTPAVNDIGLVTLADGRQFAIAVFLAGSTATEAERDQLIADTARLAIRAIS